MNKRENFRYTKAVVVMAMIVLCLAFVQAAYTKPINNDGGLSVTVAQVMGNRKAFLNKPVILNGKIAMQCSTGCWFILNDGTGQIFVDLNASNMTIPQKRGATVKVFGKVSLREGELFIIGKKVVF